MKASLKIIIAGGGTGGHIFPAIAIANALRRIDGNIKILFVGAKGKMEMEKVPQAGYAIKGIDITSFNRSSLIKNIGLPWKLLKSFFQVRTIVSDFGPDAVVGVGGYSSFPVLRFAQARGIPTFIHESNSFAGKSNIWLAKKATMIFVASDGMEIFFPASRIVYTGNPVRTDIVRNRPPRDEAVKFFGLDLTRKTVFSTGGSLGAKGINEAIARHLGEFEKNNLQLVWQTGKPFAEKARQAAEGRKNIWTNDFLTQMQYGYAAADVVISRSGAMSIAELCLVGKPVVFVPFPFAAEDHQTANAKSLVNKGAALMVNDAEANEKLVSTTVSLSKDIELQAHLSAEIRKLGVADADEVIAKKILETIG
ncbi:MAG TPA: undecaprenyldiphospho-muramoylpentapeptide beta-N-acetylglucosaminyltransferase [Puia sp.]|nr:undecaprenyldiphospho-muramoylpentapeptide beta-N-acetylglucosaminyltransferase [Puia sp.]